MEMRKTRLVPIFLSVVVCVLILFFVGVAQASGKEIFVVEPKQERVEYVNFYGSGNASGNLSVSSGRIDFSIQDPDGTIIKEFLNVSTTSFSFVANKNGNYSLLMYNRYQPLNVTVELDCNIELAFAFSSTVGISSSMTEQTSRSTVRTPPLNLEDDNGSDDPIETYIASQGVTQIQEMIDRAGSFLPLRGLSFVSCAASALALVCVASIELCGRNLLSNLRQIRYLVRNRLMRVSYQRC